jgi:adenylate cyclase
LAESVDIQRKLAAIFAADVEGYSRLMGADEVGTLKGLTERRAILDKAIADHRGRIANTAGDSVLAEFGSAVDAVQCAVAAQAALAEANAGLSPDKRINFRIGVHVGDVMVRAGDLFGDGVNIAARLQSLAQPGGVCVSGETYGQVRKVLPIAFADLGTQQVRNIEEPIRTYAIAEPSTAATLTEASRPLQLPDKPSIAVLPFQNMSGDQEQEDFADGMVEDIITALSRRKGIFVIARNSSIFYKGKQFDIRQVGRHLGVRYVLEGSVRKASGRIRITGELIEATSGVHIWADRFEGAIEDVFDLQDRMTVSVVGAIAPELERAEIARAQRKPTEDLMAYDHFLIGLAAYCQWTKPGSVVAKQHLLSAVGLDPNYARAWAQLANWYTNARINGWIEGSEVEVREAVEFARRALSIDKTDPEVLARSGWALHYIGGHSDEGVALMESATDLDPNFAMGWTWSGFARSHLGQHDLAIERYQLATRISPRDVWRHQASIGLAVALFYKRQFDEACLRAEEALRTQPTHQGSARVAIAGNAQAGRLEIARAALDRHRALDPETSISKYLRTTLFRRTEDRATMVEGLRLAGMPE